MATSDFSCVMAEKSDVNDAGVSVAPGDELDEGVVVVVLDDGLEELPQAEAASNAAETMTIVTTRLFDFLRLSMSGPSSEFSTSVSCSSGEV